MYYGSAGELWIPQQCGSAPLAKTWLGPVSWNYTPGCGSHYQPECRWDQLKFSLFTKLPYSSIQCYLHFFPMISSLGIAWPWPCPLNTPSYLLLLKQLINSARRAPTIVLFFKKQNWAASSEIILSKQRQLVNENWPSWGMTTIAEIVLSSWLMTNSPGNWKYFLRWVLISRARSWKKSKALRWEAWFASEVAELAPWSISGEALSQPGCDH